MVEATSIQAHMEVLASDGSHLGTVDGIEAHQIKLTRKDSPDGQHHFIPLSAVERVDEQVHLPADAEVA